MSELPKGWQKRSIHDVIEDCQAGFASGKKDFQDGLNHLRMNNLTVDGRLDLRLLRTVPPRLANERHILKKGDVIVCTTNSGKLVGKCGLFDLDGRYAFSNHLTRLRPRKSVIDSEFLFRRLWLMWKQGQFEHSCKHWVNQSTLPKEKLLQLEIALPPLNEQRRIVAKLKKLLSRVDAAQARLAKIPLLLKRFRQSVLAAACSGRLTADWRIEHPKIEAAENLLDQMKMENRHKAKSLPRRKQALSETMVEKPEDFPLPESWTWALSDDVFYYVTSGSRGWAKYYSDDGPIFFRVGNLDHDTIDLDYRNVQHVKPPANAEGQRTRVMDGDVVVSITADVGMVGLVQKLSEEAYINQHIALARPVSCIDKRYVSYFLASENGGQHQFKKLQRGMTKVGLGLEDIKCVWIALPPLEEQLEIVKRIDCLLQGANALEIRVLKSNKCVGNLKESILGLAFRGYL